MSLHTMERKEEPARLVADLVKCIEELMPGIPHIAPDIGLINDTMVRASVWLRGKHDPNQIEMDITPPIPAVARNTDPRTSKDTAKSWVPEALNECRRNVLRLINDHGKMTDHTLYDRYVARHGKVAWSTPCRRRGELTRMGYVRDTGEKQRTDGGRLASVWEITVAGQEALRGER